jgi:class 3 adenylate cyclase
MASIKDTLSAKVKSIIADDVWEIVKGQGIPESLGLGNKGSRIKATILYADLAESTALVENYTDSTAAEVYKTYLYCAVKIIINNGGYVASFDGDRVMGVYHGGSPNTSAAKSALQINYAVVNIINPQLTKTYPSKGIVVKAACGVDTSDVLVINSGIRNNNDFAWIGRAANHAAKLCSLRHEGYSSWITKEVYDAMSAEAKTSEGKAMWEARTWTKYDRSIYRSSWTWTP